MSSFSIANIMGNCFHCFKNGLPEQKPLLLDNKNPSDDNQLSAYPNTNNFIVLNGPIGNTIHLTDINDGKWFIKDQKYCTYYWKLIVQHNTRIHHENSVHWAENFKLSEKLCVWSNINLCKIIVAQDGYALRHVKTQTDEICKMAVSNDGLALLFVKNQTEEICMVAVKQNPYALLYVKKQTKAIQKAAFNSDKKVKTFIRQ
jgi:ribosomal protein L24E